MHLYIKFTKIWETKGPRPWYNPVWLAHRSVSAKPTYLKNRIQLAIDEIESAPKRDDKSLSLEGARKYILARLFKYRDKTKRISDRVFFGTAIAAALLSAVAFPVSLLNNKEVTASFFVGGLLGIALSLAAVVANNVPRLSDEERASVAEYLRAKVHKRAIKSLEGSIQRENNVYLAAAGVIGISGLSWLFVHVVHFVSQPAQPTDLIALPIVSIIGVTLWIHWTNDIILRALSLSR